MGETITFLEYGLTAKNKPLKDYLDIRGHDFAISALNDIVLKQIPLTESTIRELHKILLHEAYEIDVIDQAGNPAKRLISLGEYKKFPNHVITPTGEKHYYASPEETPILMGDLVKWLNEETSKGEKHILEIATEFHHRFTAIHPFDDGNGRMARLLMNLVFLRENLPPVILLKEQRNNYIAALGMADTGNRSDLLELIGTRLIESLKIIENAAKGESIDEPSDAQKRIKLLAQRVRHIDDPIVLGEDNFENIFKEIILPLVTPTLDALIEISLLFEEVHIHTQGAQIKKNSQNSWHGGEIKSIAGAQQAFRTFANGQMGVPSNFQFQFNFRHFKKSPLNPFNLSFVLSGNLETHFFLSEGKKFIYGTPVSDEQIAEFVNLKLEDPIRKIEAHIEQLEK